MVSFQWLASGQEIAYRVSSPSDTDTFTSVLASLEGRVLWEKDLEPAGYGFDFPPTSAVWSPDGQLVAVFSEGAVSIEDREGRSVWTGTSAPPPFLGTWSPGGKAFAFGEGGELVVVSRDGTSVSRLDVARLWEERLNYACTERGVYPNDRSGFVLKRAVFAPDGQRVAVAVNCLDSAGTGGWPDWMIYEASLDGLIEISSPEPRLSIDGLEAFLFSPDGGRIAWLQSRQGEWCPGGAQAFGVMGLTLLNPDDGTTSGLRPREIAQLVGDLATEGRAADIAISPTFREIPAVWSPVGDAIVASFRVTKCVCFDFDEACAMDELAQHRLLTEGVYLLRIDGVADEKIAEGFSETVSWSPSGDLIAYSSTEAEEPQIRVFDLVTREVTDLGPGDSPAWRPLAPDAATLPWEGAVTDNLRIRSEPNTRSDTVGTLSKGTKVRVYGEAEGEEAEPGSGNRIWYRVIGGWVYSAFVER